MGLLQRSALLGFVGVLAASLIAALDLVALSIALPTIADDLQASSIEIYWTGIIFILASIAFQPLFPSLSNAFGRRPVFLIALVLFSIGTVVCGSAQNVAALLAGRAIQGTGAGGILTLMMVVMADLFHMRQRPIALAINGLVWLLGCSVGPIMSGAFTEGITWRWLFWICLPIAGIAFVLILGFLNISLGGVVGNTAEDVKEPAVLKVSVLGRCRDVDWFGALILMTGLSSTLAPITWGGTLYSWGSWHTLLPLVFGVCGCIGWVVYEAFVPLSPILPVTVLKNRTTLISFIATMATGLIQFGLIYYLPLYYQIVKGYSPVISGVALLAVTLPSGLLTFVVGNVMSKTGKYKMIILLGSACNILGCGLLVLLDIRTSVAAWIFISIPLGLAMGFLFPSIALASQVSVSKKDMAAIAGLSPFFRGIGQAIGIALGNAFVKNILRSTLESVGALTLRENAAGIAANMASPALLAKFMQDPIQKHELLLAYVQALRSFWWLCFGVATFAGVLSIGIRVIKLEDGPKAIGQSTSVDELKQENIESTVKTQA